MAKTELTIEIERALHKEMTKLGTFSCFEMTIGFNKRNPERVDFITYNTKGIWRCFEIKVSKSDFHSKCKNTFVGNYNYYVMPIELFKDVKDEIPKHIGVYVYNKYISCKKNAKKQDLVVDENILKDSMIRSLSRDVDKFYKTCDVNYVNRLKSRIDKLEKENREEHRDNIKYRNAVFEVCNKFNLDRKEVRKVINELLE